MQRIIVTGANGAGKSHFAARLGALRPKVPVLSYDAMKLTRDWVRHPTAETHSVLAQAMEIDAWILEGGPSLLPQALSQADGVVWLDPPTVVRAWRLAVRPWRGRGRVRPELPAGNVDWVRQQYRFGWASLRKTAAFRTEIRRALGTQSGRRIWHCRAAVDLERVLEIWGSG